MLEKGQGERQETPETGPRGTAEANGPEGTRGNGKNRRQRRNTLPPPVPGSPRGRLGCGPAADLARIMDIPAVQRLMEDLHGATGIGAAILDLRGAVLVASGWQDICTGFHRRHPETLRNCIESDTTLTTGVKPGEFRLYKCRNSMWDMSTPIVVGGNHVGNLFLGQFVFAEEEPDEDVFRRQAQRYGFDEDAYMDALRRVPRWPRATVSRMMSFYAGFASLISKLGYGNLELARVLREREEAERASHESEANFRGLCETSVDLILTVTPDGRILYANQAFLRRLGYSMEDLAGMHVLDLHPSDRRQEAAAILTGILQGSQDCCPLPVVAKDGTAIPVETRVWHGRWNGAPCLFGVIKDLTTEMEAQQRFDHVFRNNPALMALTALPERRFVEVNEAFLQTMGYSRAEVIGRTSAELGLFADPQTHAAAAARLVRDGRVADVELRVRRRDGRLLDGLFSGEVITSHGKQFFLTVMVNITERKALEAQLRQAQKLESVGQLAGGIAHDFNNLLGVILGYVGMALDRLSPADPVHADLTVARDAARRSAELTKQLLGFARKQTITPKLLDLNHTVEGMLDVLRRLVGEAMELDWRPCAQPWLVKMDPTQVDQILANLCVNARDAVGGSRHGRIVIETRNVTLDQAAVAAGTEIGPGDYVQLVVADNGCGMEDATLARVFEPFFTTKGPGRGTGMGLPTVYGIVKQNHGLITVASEIGRGTTFTILLPRQSGQVVQAAEPRPAPRATGSGTILLVEDEPATLHMARIMLRKQGYAVLAAATPSQAIQAAESHPGEIHLLLTDVVMPEMNGRDLADLLLPRHPDMRVLFMSGYPAHVMADRHILGHGARVLQKPFERDDLLAEVGRALTDGRQA